jgi:hypothetical protein
MIKEEWNDRCTAHICIYRHDRAMYVHVVNLRQSSFIEARIKILIRI